VSAAGYNAYHELIHLGLPALYVPMPRQTDEQAARARYAERAGVGLAVDGPGSRAVESQLDRLLDAEIRGGMREQLVRQRFDNGAGEAATWLDELAGSEPRRGRSTPRWRRYLRHPLRSARRAAPFAARMPIAAGAVVKQTIERRPPRTVVLALGVPDGELERRLDRALSETPDPPGRVLVVTDSLDLAPLRRAGVGFEHVPAAGEAQAELGAGGRDEFVRRRLELILAERPKPKRTISIGSSDAAPAATAPATLA
jgi:hypothetical protein